VIKVDIISNKTNGYFVLLDMMYWEGHNITFLGKKRHALNLIIENIKFKLKAPVQIYWPVVFKSVKIVKDKQRNYARLKEAKEN